MKRQWKKWLIIVYTCLLIVGSLWYFRVDEYATIDFYTPLTPDNAINTIKGVGLDDFVIDYQLMIDKTPTHIVLGNANILLKNMNLDYDYISYSDRMIIVGEKTANEDPRKRYKVGEEHEMFGRKYDIEAIIKGEEGIYYFDKAFYDNYETKAIKVYAIPYRFNDRLISMKFVEESLKGMGIDADVTYQNNWTKYQLIKYVMTVISLTILFTVTLNTYFPRNKQMKKKEAA